MTVKKKKALLLAAAASILLGLIAWAIWGNMALELHTYTVSSCRLPKQFDGYRIAHVSDLHNTEIGKDNETLLTMLRNAEPDIIAITGDLIDSRNTNIEIALRFVQQAVTIAPCYYVTGNHEARVSAYDALKIGMEEAGVIILEDARMKIIEDGESITVIGVNDPSYQTDYLFGDAQSVVDSKLAQLCPNSAGFTILLSHRPELFESYVKNDVDLVLSGHAHGGQIRLPFVGGLIAPNQGLFPKYDAGLYTKENTNMIVSRGIGNSILPLRINNPPEIILIQLQCAG